MSVMQTNSLRNIRFMGVSVVAIKKLLGSSISAMETKEYKYTGV